MNSPKNQQIEFDVFPKDKKENYSYLTGVKGEASPETAPINVIFSHQSIIIVFIGAIMLLSRNSKSPAPLGVSVLPDGANISPSAPETRVNAAAILASAKTAVPVVAASNPVPAAQTSKPEALKPEAPADKPLPGGYAIQIASVKSQNAAKQLTESLMKKGWTSFTKNSGEYVVVLAGNFSKREEAQSNIKELKKTYTDCFIKKII
jgi:cell division septation protein DedD